MVNKKLSSQKELELIYLTGESLSWTERNQSTRVSRDKSSYRLTETSAIGAGAQGAREDLTTGYTRSVLSPTSIAPLVAKNADEPRCGRPVTDKVDDILEKVKQDRRINFHDIAEQLKIDRRTVLTHLKEVGFTEKLDIWVSHERKEGPFFLKEI
ncbi:Histone-lysine N-methyltransferase SETMAR [Eumeta japonica]|uniref:Histone-lysine N-methyltransferase SETMAR n=1 Tax=Eumeta variegata TaxID=151549 RepID=A0A4C1XK84_EUMVA|nr:Histone-lysine N-methyltransferase SETMAR [Eumeta japonica]